MRELKTSEDKAEVNATCLGAEKEPRDLVQRNRLAGLDGSSAWQGIYIYI
jgi:hypothetical protein